MDFHLDYQSLHVMPDLCFFSQESVPSYNPEVWLGAVGRPPVARRNRGLHQERLYTRSQSMPQKVGASALSAVMEADGGESQVRKCHHGMVCS